MKVNNIKMLISPIVNLKLISPIVNLKLISPIVNLKLISPIVNLILIIPIIINVSIIKSYVVNNTMNNHNQIYSLMPMIIMPMIITKTNYHKKNKINLLLYRMIIIKKEI